MCSHCLFPVVDKYETRLLSSSNKVDEDNRLTTGCSSKSDILSARNRLLQIDDNKLVATCYDRAAFIIVWLEQLVRS
jgi:hypothetical protein